MSVALSLVFSAIGLSLVFLTQVSLRSGLIKKNTTVLDTMAENGLKQGYLSLADLLAGRPFPLPLEEDRLAVLRADAEKKGTALVEEALGRPAQWAVGDVWGACSWQGGVSVAPERFEDLDSFIRAEFKAVIRGQGKIDYLAAIRSASLEISLDIIAGLVPLADFPVLLSRPGQPDDPSDLPDLAGLTFHPEAGLSHLSKALFADQPLLPQDARPALEEALKIKLFSPQDLSARRLRQALGLEENNEPVPEGVYLVRSDLGLGGVFVQGDLEELITAVAGDAQLIYFRNKNEEWTLKFDPVRGWTEFAGPGSTETFDDLVEPVIVVDGAIQSLGGGMPDEEGKLRLCLDEEIPSVLRGVRLTLVSSGRITLSAHLIQQGVTWQQGLPYIKESESQLFIFSTGAGLISGEAMDGGIAVGPNAPRDLKIQAELVASGRGFRIDGRAKNIHLLGSLQAADIDLSDNTLEVSHDPGLLKDNELARRLLSTASPVLLVSSFRPLVWRDHD
jgi:hypothetical protein